LPSNLYVDEQQISLPKAES